MNKSEVITLGAGCFWCIEAILKELKGVVSLVSGYTGGQTINPTYQDICTGTTGHAEVAQITFDSNIISLEEILEVFFTIHDPTTLNRQGNDIGTQYRSAIFYHTLAQKNTAEKIIQSLDENGAYPSPIVTEISKLGVFYKAEDYHQNYAVNNIENLYCQMIIQPKIEKFKLAFPNKIRA